MPEAISLLAFSALMHSELGGSPHTTHRQSTANRVQDDIKHQHFSTALLAL